VGINVLGIISLKISIIDGLKQATSNSSSSGGMGGYEINYLNLIEIRDWCNKSLEYIKNEVVKHEST
jgi:hypothetical protein